MDQLGHNEILVLEILIILVAGFISGAVCRYFHISTIVGYLVIGALIGEGSFGLLSGVGDDLHNLAEIGALFLLFSIGTEISWEEIKHVGVGILVAGVIQLVAVSVPACLIFHATGVSWSASALLGAAVALSSTVLVFRALNELNVATSPGGIRSVGILLFQDMAIVPLMLAVPMLAGTDDRSALDFVILAGKSLFFVATVPIMAFVVHRFALPLFSILRSRELLLLFALALLGTGCFVAHLLELPTAFGAFGAGLILGGNRFTQQVDALTLPFRETFAAVFFISLGALLNFGLLLENPWVVLAAFPLVLLVKTLGAGIALRMTGIAWVPALLLGMGLSQVGELSFLLLSAGMEQQLINDENYNQMLILAISTMVITPGVIRFAIRTLGDDPALQKRHQQGESIEAREAIREAVMIGVGPVARQVASRLEITGAEVRFVDLNSVNTYPLLQAGFRAVTGDATKKKVLEDIEIAHANLVLVSVPHDEASILIVKNIRSLNRHATVLARCRYQRNRDRLISAGADFATDEESQTALTLLSMIEKLDSGDAL